MPVAATVGLADIPPVLDTVRRYFSANRPSGVVAAFLFGNHARGSPHAESDLKLRAITR